MTLRVLQDVVLFGVDSARSRAYLSLLLADGMRPAACIVLSTGEGRPATPPERTTLFDNQTPIGDAARRSGTEVVTVSSKDINSDEAASALARRKESLAIYSGPGGALVRAPLFATGKRFLHAHPGRLPDYRGSTTMYYSLLAEERIWVTALLLDAKIDQGPIVGTMQAEVPADRRLLDQVFDPLVRARLMRRVLRRYLETGALPATEQPRERGRTYFVIHPVLKHIAILSQATGARSDCGEPA